MSQPLPQPDPTPPTDAPAHDASIKDASVQNAPVKDAPVNDATVGDSASAGASLAPAPPSSVNAAQAPPPPPWFPQAGPSEPPESAAPITADDISGIQAEMAKPERVPPPPPRMTPAPAKKKATRPDLASRGLLLIWCFWLLGSWGVSVGLDSSMPAIRWMIFSAMLGMLLVWPMLRLSQDHPKAANTPRPTLIGTLEAGTPMTPGAVFSDWLSLNMIFQLVVWIVRLSARWTIAQAGWLSLAMAAWSLIVAALLIIGCRSDKGSRRTLIMGVCILIFIGEPAVLAILNLFQSSRTAFNWPLSVSPVQAIWVMSGPPSGWESRVWAPRIKVVALAALALWLVVLITSRRGVSKPSG